GAWCAGLERLRRPGVNGPVRWATAEVGSTCRRRGKTPAPGVGDFAFMTVPLRARGRTLGALSVFALASHQHFGHDDLVVGEALGAQAGLALENAQLYEAQRAMVARLEVVRGELDAAQGDWLREDERRRIARELHDHVQQTFFAIGLAATSALDKRERDPTPITLTSALTRAQELAAAGTEQLRAAIFALNHAEFAG